MADDKTYTQAEIDKLIDEAKTATIGELTAEREKNRTLRSELDGMKADLDKIKGEADTVKSQAEKVELEKKGKYDELLKKHTDEYNTSLAERDKQINELKSTLTGFRVDNAILSAAENAIKPDDVVTLLKSRYKITENDDGSVEVTKPDGAPVLDKDGKTVDLKGLTTTFLAENTQYVKPTNAQGGSGATGGTSGEEGKTPDNFVYSTQ